MKQFAIKNENQKITKAQLKSIIIHNIDNIYIKVKSDFNGYTDCVEAVEDSFNKVNPDKINLKEKNTYGINGLWLADGAGDNRIYYNTAKNEIYIYNCCGSQIIKIQ